MNIVIVKLTEHYIVIVGTNFVQNTRSVVLNIHVSVKDKSDDAKDRFYEELEAGCLSRYSDETTNCMTEKCGFVSQRE
jgi:hypothetical protein